MRPGSREQVPVPPKTWKRIARCNMTNRRMHIYKLKRAINKAEGVEKAIANSLETITQEKKRKVCRPPILKQRKREWNSEAVY